MEFLRSLVGSALDFSASGPDSKMSVLTQDNVVRTIGKLL